MPDLHIHAIEQLNFFAIETTSKRFPAHEFVKALDDVGERDLAVAARTLATSLAIGRPAAGRSERVRGSKLGLYELRITPRGRAGPHARLLYVCKGNAIRCALGVLKREQLTRKDIKLAEKIVRESAGSR